MSNPRDDVGYADSSSEISESEPDDDEDEEAQKLRNAAHKVLSQRINTHSPENVANTSIDSSELLDDQLPTYEEAIHIPAAANRWHDEEGYGERAAGRTEEDEMVEMRTMGNIPPPAQDGATAMPGDTWIGLRNRGLSDDGSREQRRSINSLNLELQHENSSANDHKEVLPESAFVSPDSSVIRAEEGQNQERRGSTEHTSRVVRFLIRRFNRLKTLSPMQLLLLGAVVIAIIGFIIFLGVFPSSFVYLDYYHLALKYNKITGVVDRSMTYDYGCYILGPSTAFLTFDATAHNVKKNHGVFTQDRLSIQITYYVQYFLKKDELGILHQEYGTNYDQPIRSVIESEMKNSAVPFSVDTFRLQRSMLEKYFHDRLRRRLGGDCCPGCCPTGCTNNTVCTACKPSGQCDQAFHVEVRYFQLSDVDIPTIVTERYLTRTLLKEYAEKEFLVQEKVVQEKLTLRQSSKLRNEAKEITEAANAESRKIGTVAVAKKEANLTDAYVTALSSMYKTLNILREDHKLSIMMIRALEDIAVKGKLYRTYGYENETLYTNSIGTS